MAKKNGNPEMNVTDGKSTAVGNGNPEMNVTKGAAAGDDRVELLIPLSDANSQDKVVTIVCNGKIYRIKRGVRVRVPRSVYEIWCNSEAQKAALAEATDKAIADTVKSSGEF